ncbi:MAG TPA: hypothetical protein V6D47_00405 [Oscillatoriaceae cyanobacterium]
MSTSIPPIELTKKIGLMLFPGARRHQPLPSTWSGRLAWAMELGLNWLMLALAVANLALVVFDFSYLHLRPTYRVHAPQVLTIYDPVKGITPQHITEDYLAEADQAFAQVAAAPTSFQTAATLKDLRARSLAMLQDDPFAEAHLSGVFEQIKDHLRTHLGVESATSAFTRYWSLENLQGPRLASERAFYRRDLRPLFSRNYFRRLGENGRPFDTFWRIDLCFIPFFALEFLLRGLWGLRSKRYPSWKAVCIDRWYDLVYFVPLVGYGLPLASSSTLQLLRMISVGYRMERLGLINPVVLVEEHTTRFTNVIADVVNLKLLSNYQESVRQFNLAETLNSLTPTQRAEVTHFIERNLNMLVTRVLPELSPELEAIAVRAAHRAMDQSPAYQALRQVPMFGSVTEQLLPALVAEVVGGMQKSLAQVVTDRESQRLTEKAIDRFSASLLTHMAQLGTEQDVKNLLIDMLEEQKRKLLV